VIIILQLLTEAKKLFYDTISMSNVFGNAPNKYLFIENPKYIKLFVLLGWISIKHNYFFTEQVKNSSDRRKVNLSV
jgi:hypothetical protein